jgi:processive 1,2-diacylglycerol beta-glucosyltransferase
VAEVDRIAGPGRAAPVKPLIDARFLRSPSREVARAELELRPEAPVLMISGGGWGLGDLEGAAWTALQYDPKARAICLAGRNEAVRSRLQRGLGAHPRARILGFTERMPELLAAADAIVHTTGGTTALEARAVGCPLINYGRGIAHVRAHARALRDMDLAEWAPERSALNAAIARSDPTAPAARERQGASRCRGARGDGRRSRRLSAPHHKYRRIRTAPGGACLRPRRLAQRCCLGGGPLGLPPH